MVNKRKFVLTLIGLFLIVQSVHAKTSENSISANAGKQVAQNILNIVPAMLDFRQNSIATYLRLSEKVDKDDPFSREELDQLEKLTLERKIIREKLYSLMISSYQKIKSIKNRQIEKKAGPEHFAAASMGATALFFLDDNYLLETSLYQGKYRFRAMLNRPNQTIALQFKDGLEKSRRIHYSFKSIYYRFKFMKFIVKEMPQNKKTIRPIDESLQGLLLTSPSFIMRLKMSYGERLVSNLKLTVDKIGGRLVATGDFIRSLKNKFVFGVSYAFGKTVAQIQWKKGKLYFDSNAYTHVKETMIPGDILWDRTRFKVSGRLISIDSFWHHNAIYIGTKDQLQELGIWYHPLVKKYRSKIEQGKIIVEALGMGVVMNSIHHFMNIDDLAIARKKEITKEDQINYVLRALAEVGKMYDFNLELDSGDTLICSEVIDVVLKDVTFPRKKVIGVWSITPDLTATQTLEGGALDLILFYVDGQRLEGNFIELMKEFLWTKDVKDVQVPLARPSGSETTSAPVPTAPSENL